MAQEISFAQIIITALLSSGFVGGLIALFTKKLWSPESKNELARLGNEFAQQLLRDAKDERAELRLTIAELENIKVDRNETIHRLKVLADEKDKVIDELELRLVKMARKLQQGHSITLRDIFGSKAPPEFHIAYEESV